MALVVRDLPPLIATSSGSSFTNFVGKLDDASALTIYVTSSATAASTGAGAALLLQVTQYDPTDPVLPVGVGNSVSTAAYSFSLTSTTAGLVLLSTGAAYTINNVSFRGLRLANLTSAAAGEIVAYVSKQISV